MCEILGSNAIGEFVSGLAVIFLRERSRGCDGDIWQSRVERMRLMHLFGLRENWEDIAPQLGTRFRAFVKREVLETGAVPAIPGLPSSNHRSDR